MRLALRAQGLRVEPQVHILGLGWVDFLVDGIVVVEVDGFAYHSGRQPYREDRRRDRVAGLLGLSVARFTFEDAIGATGRSAFEVAEMAARARRAGIQPLPAHLMVRSA